MTDDLHELSALYALDALDDADRERFERHLAGCEDCRRELASLGATAASLAYAADGPAPPPGLRGRILDAARAEPQNVVPLRRRRIAPRVAAVAAVAAGVAALLVGIPVMRNDAPSVDAILKDPDARHVQIGNGRGELVVTSSGDAALSVSLPALPSGKVYEAWVADPDVHRAGEFTGRRVKLTHDVHDGAQVMVTVEREGGVDAPTGAPLFAVRA
jgi:anti-sigma factor RsiW